MESAAGYKDFCISRTSLRCSCNIEQPEMQEVGSFFFFAFYSPLNQQKSVNDSYSLKCNWRIALKSAGGVGPSCGALVDGECCWMCRFLVANFVFSGRKGSCWSSFSCLEEGTEGWSPEITGMSKQLHPSSDSGVKHL